MNFEQDETFYEKTFFKNKSDIEKEIFCQFRMKYQSNEYTYFMKIANDLIFNEKTKLVSRFKDFLIYDDTTEFLKRFYDINQNKSRLKKILEFYEMYSKIFPNYIILPEREFLYKNIRRKQKMIDQFNNIKRNSENPNSTHRKKGDDKFFNTHIEMSINKCKPLLSIHESQMQISFISSYKNNVTSLNSFFNTNVKQPDENESFISIENILNAFNNKTSITNSSSHKLKDLLEIKSKEMMNSEKIKHQMLKLQLQNKKEFLKLNIKKLHDFNLIKLSGKPVINFKAEVTASNQNSMQSTKILSENIKNQKFMNTKFDSHKDLKPQVNSKFEGEKKQIKFNQEKKKIIHRISSSIPDLRNYKILYNNPNILEPNVETHININQNFYDCDKKRRTEADRIIIVENLNIYNNTNHNSNDSYKLRSNNYMRNIQHSKIENNNSIMKKVSSSPYSSNISKRTQSIKKDTIINKENRNNFSKDSAKKTKIQENSIRKEKINLEVKNKSSSIKDFYKVIKPKYPERNYFKTLTNSNSKSKVASKIFRDNRENKYDLSLKSSENLVKSIVNKNPVNKNNSNNILANSIGKMKEIKNAYKLFLEKKKYESLTTRNSLELNSHLPIKILNTEILNENFTSHIIKDSKNFETTKYDSFKSTATTKSGNLNLKFHVNINNKRNIHSNSPSMTIPYLNPKNFFTSKSNFRQKEKLEMKEYITIKNSREKSNEKKIVSTEPVRKEPSLTEPRINTTTSNKLNLRTIINKDNASLLSSLKDKKSTVLVNKINLRNIKITKIS